MIEVEPRYLTKEELEVGLENILQSPRDEGRLDLIVRRPATNKREVLAEGELCLNNGLIGDSWKFRGSSKTADGSAHPDMQINIMNSRLIHLVAQERERWQLAGDQLYIDIDLSEANLPPGTRLEIGSAVIEITAIPHTGCEKFMARFGRDAVKFVNSREGKSLRLRGVNARVVKPGRIVVGDIAKKL